MFVLYPWIPKQRNKYYFFTLLDIKNTVSWKSIQDIVCINKYCERFCKEYNARFYVYSPGDEIPENICLKFAPYQAIFAAEIEFETRFPLKYSISHEPGLTNIFSIEYMQEETRYNHNKDEYIDIYQQGPIHDLFLYLDSVKFKIPCRKTIDNTYDICIHRIANLYRMKTIKQIQELLYTIEVDRIVFRKNKCLKSFILS